MLTPLAILVGLFALVLTLAAGPYAIIGNNVNCRSGPSIRSGVMRQYHHNNTDEVTLVCQIEGDVVDGWRLWDRTTDGEFCLPPR
jgi:hypothetical protein